MQVCVCVISGNTEENTQTNTKNFSMVNSKRAINLRLALKGSLQAHKIVVILRR